MNAPAIGHDEAVARIAVEYIEMPDLKLTAPQARRLWNIPGEVCDRALAALVEREFLVQTRASLSASSFGRSSGHTRRTFRVCVNSAKSFHKA